MNDVGESARMTSMSCHYVVAALLPLRSLSEERTAAENVLRLPDGATCQSVAVAMAAVVGEQVIVETFASRKVDGGVSMRVDLRRAPASSVFMGCRLEYELGPLQERLDAMTLAIAAQHPGWLVARRVLRSLIVTSMELTREQEAPRFLEPILPSVQAAMAVDSVLVPGVSGALYAVMVKGSLPVH